MHIIRHLELLPLEARGGAVTIGNFDGVHQGHLAIVRQLLKRAESVGGPAIVFTFDPHPVRVLRPDQSPSPLTWTERKAELLAAQGVDWIIAYPTDEALLNLSANGFFQKIIQQTLAARALVEGPNFYFGHNREGTVATLEKLSATAGISLDIVPPVEIDGVIVSSSRVRKLIAAGEVDQARQLLSAPYRIRGMVTHGAGRGGKIGFPTANLAAIDTLVPAQGVYAGRALVGNESYAAAINLGPSPTFGDPTPRVEIHLLDFDGTLYGEPLEVDFLTRLRDIRPFASPADLVEQLKNDVATARSIATTVL